MSAPPRSFAVTVTRGRPWLLAVVALGAPLGAAGLAATGAATSTVAAMGMVATIASLSFALTGASRRADTLAVSADGITLGRRTLPRAGLDLSVLEWRQGVLWTEVGTALELRGPSGVLRIGATGGNPPRAGLGVTPRVDASVSSADLTELARTLGVESLLARPASGDVAIDLMPSPTGLAAFRSAGPWILTMVMAGGVGVVGSLLGLDRSPSGGPALGVVATLVVLGGFAYTVRAAGRPPAPRWRLVVSGDEVRLLEVRAPTRPTADAERVVRAVPVTYRYRVRGGTYELPALRLGWAGRPPLVVGVWDPSLGWRSGEERTRRIDFVVGAEHWRVLVGALGLG
ncbi:MAG: hypothetical protein FJ104_09630 [Deltaproteobacteria bacterium]|nr:hypothetical protein [Deltaproteobacteria bacterium]